MLVRRYDGPRKGLTSQKQFTCTFDIGQSLGHVLFQGPGIKRIKNNKNCIYFFGRPSVFFMAYLSQLLAPTWWLVISEEDEPPRTRKQKISISQKNSKNRLNCIETVARRPVQNYDGKTKDKAKAGHVKFFLCLKKLKVRSDVRFADVECINKIFIN